MPGPLAYLVAIPAFAGAEPGMESGRSEVEAEDGKVRGEEGVEPSQQVGGRVPPGGAEDNHLAGGVDAGVGAAGADDSDRLLGEALRRSLKLSLHRASLGLNLKAEKVGAVVLDDRAVERAGKVCAGHSYSTSSSMAISAPSPLRCPILKMRV